MATKDTLQLQDTKVTSMKIRTFIKILQYEEYPNLNNPVLLFQFTLNPVSNSKSTEKKSSVNMLIDFDCLLKQISFCNLLFLISQKVSTTNKPTNMFEIIWSELGLTMILQYAPCWQKKP